jgi:hypothetical protein
MRQAAAEDFALAAHYAESIIRALQVGDDVGAMWNMNLLKGAGRRAFAAFAPIRAAMKEQGALDAPADLREAAE